MKLTFKLSLILLSLFLSSTSKAEKGNKLVGTWQLIESKANRIINTPTNYKRTWELNKDNTFYGTISFPNGDFSPHSQGIYLLANDSTMVTIRSDDKGNLSKLSFVYNFKFHGDSLHRYGFYLQGVTGNPGILQPVFTDEWWVKMH